MFTTSLHHFPGPVHTIRKKGRGENAESYTHEMKQYKAHRRAVALAEDRARRPHRLVLWADASTRAVPGNGTTAVRSFAAVAWQEYNPVTNRWEWRERIWPLDMNDEGHRRTDRAEFQAISGAVGDVAYNQSRATGHLAPMTEAVVYSDSDNALKFIKDPVGVAARQDGDVTWQTAGHSLQQMVVAAIAMQLSVSTELGWAPKGIAGNVWADCWARYANGACPTSIIQSERGNAEDDRPWTWWALELYLQGRLPQDVRLPRDLKRKASGFEL